MQLYGTTAFDFSRGLSMAGPTDRVSRVGLWLRKVVVGYYQYHAVPGNTSQLNIFMHRIRWLWRAVMIRRSQRARISWERINPLLNRWVPYPYVLHPDRRFATKHPR